MTSKQVFSEHGLILVGNSGVGKSFLANLFLNENHFQHGFSARSVTHRTESIRCEIAGRSYRLYNIPGLIEGNQERVALNREQIQQAFNEQKHNPIVIIYVFGHQNGRIRHEDVVSFQLMNKAYQFSQDSLLIIVNGLPSDRPENYNDQTQQLLIDLIKMKLNQICFVDHLDANDLQKRSEARKSLINALGKAHPEIHSKTDKIDLIDDQIVDLYHHLNRLRLQWTEEKIEHEEIIEQMEQTSLANERLGELRRLFFKAKTALDKFADLAKQEEHLNSVIEYWHNQENAYKNRSTSTIYQSVSDNKEDAERKLQGVLSQRRWLNVSLNQYRKDIEQTCYELKQIYRGEFDRKCEACREYFILFDDLRFDSSIETVQNDFLHDLFVFTRLYLDQID